jgi:hypothetical protein
LEVFKSGTEVERNMIYMHCAQKVMICKQQDYKINISWGFE